MRTYYADANGNMLGGDKKGGFLLFTNGENVKEDVYSDRLSQWDYQKVRDLKEKHFGKQSDYWPSEQTPEKVEAFLKEYMGKDIVLCKITEYENQSNGYPYWRFGYYEKGKEYAY
jgi:hypothetical protein